MSTIRIAIVGDDKAEKESLKTHLSARSGISVVFDTDDGEAAMREIERDKTAIDVVITQVLMAGVSGLDLIEHFAEFAEVSAADLEDSVNENLLDVVVACQHTGEEAVESVIAADVELL